ncbi:MAG TPA: enterotoxin, partial [Rhodanobacteraceae bacterium]|nr:enterotoxin [Rhodanobacteraceae bacterium]
MLANHRRAVRARLGWIILATAGGAMLAAKTASAHDHAAAQRGQMRFGNTVIAAALTDNNGALADLVVTDERHHVSIAVTDPFSLTLKDGSTINTCDFHLQGALREIALPVDARASRLADRIPGKAVEGTFLGPKGNLRLDWKLVQRDGSDYLREIVTITALDEDVPITKVSLFGADAADATVDGSVDGSPVVSHDDWFGFEHPMSKADAWRGKVKLWI